MKLNGSDKGVLAVVLLVFIGVVLLINKGERATKELPYRTGQEVIFQGKIHAFIVGRNANMRDPYMIRYVNDRSQIEITYAKEFELKEWITK